MKFDLSIGREVEKFNDRCKWLIEKGKKVEIKAISGRRSNPQNNYFHLICTWWGLEHGYNLDAAKTFFKRRSPDIFVYEIKGEKYLKSSKDIDKAEMTIVVERIRDYSAQNGFYIPAPNEHEYLRHIENEIELTHNKIYI